MPYVIKVGSVYRKPGALGWTEKQSEALILSCREAAKMVIEEDAKRVSDIVPGPRTVRLSSSMDRYVLRMLKRIGEPFEVSPKNSKGLAILACLNDEEEEIGKVAPFVEYMIGGNSYAESFYSFGSAYRAWRNQDIDNRDCSKDPCKLCKDRARFADIFVANMDDGTFTCGSCIPLVKGLMKKIDNDGDVEIWEVGSGGWTKQISCHLCKEDIEVEVMDAVDIAVDADGDKYFVCKADGCGLRSWLEKAGEGKPGTTVTCGHCFTEHFVESDDLTI